METNNSAKALLLASALLCAPPPAEAGGQELDSLFNNRAEDKSQEMGEVITNLQLKVADLAQELIRDLFRENFLSGLKRVETLHSKVMEQLLEGKIIPVVDGKEMAINKLLIGFQNESNRAKDPILEVYRYEALIRMLTKLQDTLKQLHRYYVGQQRMNAAAYATVPDSKEGRVYTNAVKQANLAEERLRGLSQTLNEAEKKLDQARSKESQAQNLALLQKAERVYASYWLYGIDREKALAELKQILAHLNQAMAANMQEGERIKKDTSSENATALLQANEREHATLNSTREAVFQMIKCVEEAANVGNPFSSSGFGKESEVSPAYEEGEAATTDEANSQMKDVTITASVCPEAQALSITLENPFANIQDPVVQAHSQAWLAQLASEFFVQMVHHDGESLDLLDGMYEAAKGASTNMQYEPTVVMTSKQGKKTVAEDLAIENNLREVLVEEMWKVNLARFCVGIPMDACYQGFALNLTVGAKRGVRPWSRADVDRDGAKFDPGQVCNLGHFNSVTGVTGPMLRGMCDATRQFFDVDGNCSATACSSSGQHPLDGSKHLEKPFAGIPTDFHTGKGVPNTVELNNKGLEELVLLTARGAVADGYNLDNQYKAGKRQMNRHE